MWTITPEIAFNDTARTLHLSKYHMEYFIWLVSNTKSLFCLICRRCCQWCQIVHTTANNIQVRLFSRCLLFVYIFYQRKKGRKTTNISIYCGFFQYHKVQTPLVDLLVFDSTIVVDLCSFEVVERHVTVYYYVLLLDYVFFLSSFQFIQNTNNT